MNSALKACLASLAVFLVIVVGFLLLEPSREVGLPPPPRPDAGLGTSGALTPTPDAARVPVDRPPAPREGVEVTVRVLDKANGRPLPKALVRANKSTDLDSPGELIWDSTQGGERGEGVFRFQLVPGAYLLHAQCRGFAGERRTVTIVKDQSETFTFSLDRGDSISGRVLDTGGRGIANAHVLALKEFASPDADLETMLIGLIHLPEMTNEVYSETYSSEDGSYQLDGLKDASWFTVRAIAQGYSPNEVKQVPAPRERVDVVLDPGGAISGTVVDAGGRPIEAARVDAYRVTESQAMFEIILERSRPPVDSVETTADGSFEFETLGTGVYNFRVTARGFQPHTESKARIASGTELKFRLDPGLTIAGFVLGPNDEPVAGARIRAQRIGGAAVRPEIVHISFDDDSVRSDQDGAFVFDTLKNADYNLLVMHEDYQTLRRKGARPDGGELTLRMSFGGRIRGSVTSVDGTPVPGARLVAGDVADNTKEAVTDEFGEFVMHGVQTGRRAVSVAVTADGYAKTRSEVKVPEGSEVEQNFTLERLGHITGSVVNSNGDPVRDAILMVKRTQETSAVDYTIANGRTDARGRYNIEVEAGEKLWVRVKRTGFLEGRTALFTLEPGAQTELPPVMLDLGGALAGRVVGPDGSGVAGCVVTMMFEGQTETTASLNPSVSTDARGEFRLQGLQSGSLDLVVKPTNMLDKVVSGIVVEEGRVVSGLVVELERGNELRGRVVDGKGQPVVGATVIAHDFSRGATQVRAASDVNGRFAIHRIVANDVVELEVQHENYSPYLEDNVAVGADVEIVLKALGRVTGMVVNAAGAAVTSFSVQPQAEGDVKGRGARARLHARTFTPEDGQFEYVGVPTGVYSIQLRAPGLAASTIEGVQIEEGSTVDLGRIVLESGGLVSGRVVDGETGEPVFGAQVSIVQGASRFMRGDRDLAAPSGARHSRNSTQNTDSNGTFSFAGLKGGTLTLRIKHADYVQTKVSADPDVTSESRDLVIELARAGEISGTVLDDGGQPRRNMQVFLIGDDPTGNQRARTNSEGRFTFRSVIPGDYTVKAHEFARGDQPLQEQDARVSIGSGETRIVDLRLR